MKINPLFLTALLHALPISAMERGQEYQIMREKLHTIYLDMATTALARISHASYKSSGNNNHSMETFEPLTWNDFTSFIPEKPEEPMRTAELDKTGDELFTPGTEYCKTPPGTPKTLSWDRLNAWNTFNFVKP